MRSDGKVWYFPHHGVCHPKKTDKIRVVFDCATTNKGVALNNVLLLGPDLTSSLVGVLLRFRQKQIGIMGDIEAMFHQVKSAQGRPGLFTFLLVAKWKSEQQADCIQNGSTSFWYCDVTKLLQPDSTEGSNR